MRDKAKEKKILFGFYGLYAASRPLTETALRAPAGFVGLRPEPGPCPSFAAFPCAVYLVLLAGPLPQLSTKSGDHFGDNTRAC